MRRITAFIVAGAVLLFLICTIFSQPNRNGGSAKITVTFTGYTNEVTGGRLANFRISNLGGSGVFRWPDYTVSTVGAAPYRERMATIVVRSSPKLQQQTNAPAQAPTTNAVNPPIGASQ